MSEQKRAKCDGLGMPYRHIYLRDVYVVIFEGEKPEINELLAVCDNGKVRIAQDGDTIIGVRINDIISWDYNYNEICIKLR